MRMFTTVMTTVNITPPSSKMLNEDPFAPGVVSDPMHKAKIKTDSKKAEKIQL